MVTVAHHFAPVQGHKSLVWISGDSVLVNWDDQTVSMERRVKEIGAAINRTKEALNEAHMALYAVDAEGRVTPYQRPVGDSLATKVTIAHEKLAIYEYAQQREALDKLYEKNGPDVFVANYQVFQGPGGGDQAGSTRTVEVRTNFGPFRISIPRRPRGAPAPGPAG